MKYTKFCICISGLDGTGKSRIVDELIKYYKKNYKIKHIWSRYKNYSSKPLLFFTRIIGLNYKIKKKNITIGYHDFHKSITISFLFLFFQWIDQVIEIFIKFRLSKKNIISDRSILDTLVDLAVDTKLENFIFSIYGKSLFKLMPKNTFFFILKRDFKKIKKNRKDVFIDKNLDRRIYLYEKISHLFPIVIIENNYKLKNTLNIIKSKLKLK